MIDIVEIKVTTVGAAGSAAGTATSPRVNGKVLAVYTDYTSQPATTDVTLTSTLPAQTILTLTNANTDALDYPRSVIQNNVGANLTGVEPSIVAGNLVVTVAQGDPVVDGVVVTVYLERV